MSQRPHIVDQLQRRMEPRVTDGDDVGLNGRIRGVTGKPSGHETFIEISSRAVGVVSARGQDDGALFAHGLVAVRVRRGMGGEAKSRGFVYDGARARVTVEADGEGGRWGRAGV